ncbi:MAG: hypothetical protein II661_00585 [Bacteroidales bacterium]|nr:hypothetical protein [Bacteroidales bacterium]
MKTLDIIGYVVLYLAAGYITAWHFTRLFDDTEGECIPACTLFWPIVLFIGLISVITYYLPRKIFNKFRKQ